MSRLESMHRRLSAQIDGLNWAMEQTSDLTGDMLEIGLGNGRTYDHLRSYGAGRRIWVIDRALNCHPSCVPPKPDFLEGEASDMLRNLGTRGTRIALAHYELGIGVDEQDEAEARALSHLLVPLIVPGGIIVSQQPIDGIPQVRGPETVAETRYLFYRAPV